MATPTLDLSMVGQGQSSSTQPQEEGGIGGWVKNNLSTIGSIAAPLAATILAPETGGLSLAALAAAGGALGNVGSQVATGKDITSADSLKSDITQAALGGLGEGVGNVLGKVVGKVGSSVAGAFGKEADNLALKGIGATPSQLQKFAEKHAIVDATGNHTPESVVKWINDNGLSGQGLETITSKVNDIQGQFNKIIKDSNITVEPNLLQKNMKQAVSSFEPHDASINPLGSADPADHAIADKVGTIFENINQKLGENPTLEALNKEKILWDNKVNYNQIMSDPQQFGPYKVVADALRNTVHEAADAAGAVTNAGSLKEAGIKLSKLYDLKDIAERSAFKGTSNATPGLTHYMAATAFGGAGGPLGAVAGLALPSVLKNPTVLSTISKGFGAGATGVGKAAGYAARALESPIGRASVQGTTMGIGGTIADSMSQQPESTPGSTLQLPGNESSLPASPSLNGGGDLATQAISALQHGQPMTQSQYQSLLEKDLVTTGGRFSTQITAAYNAGNPTAVQGLGVASNATNTLQDLYNKAGGARGAIVGGIENALGNTNLTKSSVKAYNAQKLALGQEIISQIYGSSGTASDRDQVLSLIPDINDLPATAASKMATLRSLIQQRLSSMTGSTPSSVNSLSQGPSLNLQP